MTTYIIKNPTDFANALLGALGVPDSKTNVANVVGWETIEGGNWHNSAKYNPLNTTETEPGSTNFNTKKPGAGVQAYTSWQQGIDATVATLQDSNPMYGYQQIVSDLNTSQPWSDFSAALKASSWDGSGHYAGLSSTTAPGSGGNPDSQSYGTGVVATEAAGNAANSPSKTANAKKLQGFAGVLQALQGLYSPPDPGLVQDLASLGTAPIQEVATLIFVRALSSVLFIGIMAIGVKTMFSGSSGGGGSKGGTNVLEFVNNAQTTNRKLGQSQQRLSFQQEHESNVGTRHDQKLKHETFVQNEETYRTKYAEQHKSFRHRTPKGSNANPPRPRRTNVTP